MLDPEKTIRQKRQSEVAILISFRKMLDPVCKGRWKRDKEYFHIGRYGRPYNFQLTPHIEIGRRLKIYVQQGKVVIRPMVN